MSKYEIDVKDSTFEKEVIKKSSEIPVVVDFWASWCGPCKMLGPTLEKVVNNFKGKFILARISVEENQDKPQEYGVMSIPSVKLFKNGKIVDEFVGAQPEEKIIKWLSDNGIKA